MNKKLYSKKKKFDLFGHSIVRTSLYQQGANLEQRKPMDYGVHYYCIFGYQLKILMCHGA